MKTLVIHPNDVTTGFLEQIYEGKDWTVISDPHYSKSMLRKDIKEHDRIVMLGHGTQYGLWAGNRFIIDSSFVHFLREKEIVAIWCNAHEFVEKYDLKGFYTGMIISEELEAVMEHVEATEKEVLQSNILFSDAITEAIDKPNMLEVAQATYVGETDVIGYNKVRLFTR